MPPHCCSGQHTGALLTAIALTCWHDWHGALVPWGKHRVLAADMDNRPTNMGCAVALTALCHEQRDAAGWGRAPLPPHNPPEWHNAAALTRLPSSETGARRPALPAGRSLPAVVVAAWCGRPVPCCHGSCWWWAAVVLLARVAPLAGGRSALPPSTSTLAAAAGCCCTAPQVRLCVHAMHRGPATPSSAGSGRGISHTSCASVVRGRARGLLGVVLPPA
jgi:hypothetical protein